MQIEALFCDGEKQLRLAPYAQEKMSDDQLIVKTERGGICGSDLHYYAHGGFGVIKILHPMILGHETAGIVSQVGKNVTSVKIGDRVAVNPSRACGTCHYCQKGAQQHCLEMRFYGSAMRNPHIHGSFRTEIVIDEGQAALIAPHISPEEAALCEPLAVCLHGVNQAGALFGKKVAIMGCGPIGALTLLAARYAGAREIVVLDISQKARTMALTLGADHAINSLDDLSDFQRNKGYFDVGFECSGNNQALLTLLTLLKPQSTLVQLGLGGDFTYPVNMLVAKEINWKGTFRFHEEFNLAANLISKGVLNLKPLVTHVFPLNDYKKAFDLALDKTKALKVQLAFS